MLSRIPISLLRVVCWTMSALCKSDFKKCHTLLPYFKQLLAVPDDNVVSEVLWGLVHITGSASEEELVRVSCEISLSSILGLVASSKPAIKMPAICVLGNLCAGPMEISEEIMTHSCLRILANELRNASSEKVAEDLCWIVSNLSLGVSSHVQRLLDEKIIQLMCDVLSSQAGYKVKIHATYALAGATEESTEKQIWAMVGLGILESLVKVFYVGDLRPGVICSALKGLDNLMTAGQGGEGEVNPIAARFDKIGGFDIATKLMEHPNNKVAARARKLLEKFAYEQSYISEIY
eukprot:TRINITY_DN14422_c0_g1_i1.p1 TRINITY_DN14422_c0_g1~~TRINITY_DN14422_c0_g1_i1.p1  ORF type:complete len:292 (-),score=43.87 TRINITY_DN14422_c0_g1_i1:147-1022(-)